MGFDKLWDTVTNIVVAISLPLVAGYHLICGNLFLNVSIENAEGLEKVGNTLLVPFQYLFAGKEARKTENGSWEIQQKFHYDKWLFSKSIASAAALPVSLTLGASIKALGLLDPSASERYRSFSTYMESAETIPNTALYSSLQFGLEDRFSAEFLDHEGYERRPGDELYAHKAKEALLEVSAILNAADIPWWVDCGTLLGTQRYGGIIPWDNDIDIALLLPDFENAKKALRHLDPNKYMVQDWSGRDFPNTFLKIYVRETQDLLDLYFYDIHPETKTCEYIFSLENSIFFFEWFKVRERRFTKPVSFDTLFPLKRALFDGIEVFVPNNTTAFLQRYYGENLAPAKLYDPKTGAFEKDLTHPYWQIPYVH